VNRPTNPHTFDLTDLIAPDISGPDEPEDFNDAEWDKDGWTDQDTGNRSAALGRVCAERRSADAAAGKGVRA